MSLTICHFLNYAKPSGITELVFALATYSKHTHHYVTYTCDRDLALRFLDHDVQVHVLGDDQWAKAVKTICDLDADVVHAQNSGGPEPGVSIGIETTLPVVETCQSPSLPTGHMEKDVYVVPVSHGILRHWHETVRAERVIYNCAFQPKTDLSKADCRLKFGLDPERPVVGRIGRLEGIKRPQDFAQAAMLIGQIRPEVQFLLVGDGADGLGLREYARVLGESGIDIVMPGFLLGADKAAALHAMDLFLYPTTMEGFGVSFAEAMSIGLPIVTYSDPVNIDVVGPAGLYACDNEFTDVINKFYSLARLTMDLLDNPRECDKLSKYGRAIYADRYKPEIVAAQYDRLYEDIHTRKVIYDRSV